MRTDGQGLALASYQVGSDDSHGVATPIMNSGAFPPWLAPVQVVGIPVAEAFADYLADVIKQMKKAGIRAELDASDDRMQKKVRNAQMQKVPFMVIAGEEDMAAGAVSFRYRNGEQKNGIPIKDAIAQIQKVVAERTQV
mgnify:CR=1 FL=1